jgi:hypothetical protein
MSPQGSAWGTGWGRENTATTKRVPVVPNVPAQNTSEQCKTVCPHDVIERAAILEFCAGLPRKEAEALALAECTTSCGAAVPLLYGCAEDLFLGTSSSGASESCSCLAAR